MSPSWRESLRIGLCPDRVIFARYGRGLRPRLLDKGSLPVQAAPDEGEGLWRPAIAALPKLLRDLAPRPADATVVLSNHFVRYMVLARNESLANSDEWLAYASHHFEKTYGARAREWDIRIAQTDAGRPCLASAIDKALLEALAGAFKDGVARLTSVQPHLMSAFNRSTPGVSHPSFWFALQEPGRLLFGLVRDGVWQSVRSRQAGAQWHQDVPALLERESVMMGLDTPCRQVVVSSLEAFQAPQADTYKFETPSGQLADRDRPYDMVYA